MTKLGKELIAAAEEALAVASGKAEPARTTLFLSQEEGRGIVGNAIRDALAEGRDVEIRFRKRHDGKPGHYRLTWEAER
jgi:hypothetical protein